MGKSLTETAKAILMNEGAAPSVSSSGSNPDRDAKASNPNMATLRPGSKGAEGPIVNPGSTPPVGKASVTVEQPKAPGEGENVGAKVSAGQKKDTSIKGSNNPAEKSKKQAEVMEEDVEAEGEVVSEATLDEQIEAYIEQLVAEGHDEDTIMEAIEHYFGEQLAEASDVEGEMVAEEEESYQVDMSEHIEALFAGEELSEDFKTKATAIFEAAVKSKIEEEIATLEAAYAETLEEQISQIEEELSSNVDDYLNYVVEQWVSENEVAIEAGLRSELTEEFISGLRNLFAEHYIDIPEDKVSVVEEMGSKVAELEEKLNEEIERNVQLTKYLNESKQSEIVAELCEGLTATQAEKLKSLSEGLEFTSVNEYAQKVKVLRESYFAGNAINNQNVLDNNEVDNNGTGMISEDLQGPMAAYVRTLGKKLPN
jgi:hypothetical protein